MDRHLALDHIRGPDPKLEFRKPGQGASLLAGAPISPESTYWTSYYTLFDSPSDVVTLLDSVLLSNTAQRAPENLSTLIIVLSERLFDLLSEKDFPGSEERRREALNCVRVLGRVTPFVVCGADGLEERIFWREERVQVDASRTSDRSSSEVEGGDGQFVLEDEDEDDEGQRTPRQGPAAEEEYEIIPPLAERLLAALVDLAFVPGFTVAEECRTADGAVSYVIWEPGIAHSPSSPLPPTPSALLSARLEVLRLLSILLALPALLTPPHLFPSRPNRWREVLVGPYPAGGGRLERKVVLCLLCSLLNTALGKATPEKGEKDAAGGRAASVLSLASSTADKLSGVVLRREDVRGLLVQSCLQVLSVLLVEHAPAPLQPSEDNSTNTPGPSPFVEQPPTMSPTPTPTRAPPPANTFAYYLSKLHRSTDFEFLLSGFLALLERGLGGVSNLGLTTLAGAGGGGSHGNQLAGNVETLVLLWRTIEGNGKFAAWLGEQERVGEVLVWLVVAGLEGKDDETQMGLVRLSAFLLQTLTADRSPGFAARLNAPVDLRPSLRLKYGVPGTLADFIIISLCTLIFTTQGRLSSLYPAFILTIDNISPHLKNLSSVASTRLTKLFLAFAAPGFLLMEEGNPRLVYYLLETFNNIIHYQLSDNPELIYALIRSHSRFDQLSTFTLAGGVAAVRRTRQEKKAAAAAATAGTPSNLGTISEGQPATSLTAKEGEEGAEKEVSEKARGKMRERRTDSISSLSVADLSLGANGGAGAVEDGQPFIGKNGFVPTEGWVASWRGGLPLDSILIMLTELRPLVLDLPAANSAPLSTSTTSTSAAPPSALSLLSSASLSGLLPPAPTPHPRKFLTSPQSMTWLASLIYGNIYLSSLELLRDVDVKLFGIAQGGGRKGLTGLIQGGGNPLEFVSGAASALFGRVGR